VVSSSTLVKAHVKAGVLTDDERRRLEKLLDKAQDGDKKALDEIRPLLDKADLWKVIGDLGRRVQQAWLEALTGKGKFAREAFERRAETLRSDLLESGDSPLERLLVDRVVLTWLQVCYADNVTARVLSNADGYSYRSAEFSQECQDRASARHLKAVKALASVRRLLVPAVQVNIAKQQIISQGGPTVVAPESVA
jgi:hypothetical protein